MPTLKQLEEFRQGHAYSSWISVSVDAPYRASTHSDFRTIAGAPVRASESRLLDTVYLCQQRQDWYRDFCANYG